MRKKNKQQNLWKMIVRKEFFSFGEEIAQINYWIDVVFDLETTKTECRRSVTMRDYGENVVLRRFNNIMTSLRTKKYFVEFSPWIIEKKTTTTTRGRRTILLVLFYDFLGRSFEEKRKTRRKSRCVYASCAFSYSFYAINLNKHKNIRSIRFYSHSFFIRSKNTHKC